MNAPRNVEQRSAALGKMLTHFDNTYVAFMDFGCFAAVSEDKAALFTCPMNVDGSPERYEDDPRHMNWTQVSAPEPEFVDKVNEVFGTSFEWERFPGR